MEKTIVNKVRDFIQSHHLIQDPCKMIYVGLSGGPDSVALLHILKTLGYRCTALHCNFHLRGDESDRDMKFCKSLCWGLNVQLQINEFDTLKYMEENHKSLEVAARELRYGWWRTFADGVIAVGHHLDDSIETMLMNIMRGTGIDGLTGIPEKNEEANVIRPLLCLTREEILEYLRCVGVCYVTDSTNNENETIRNQIRNQLIPVMKSISPNYQKGFSTTMENLRCNRGVLNELVKNFLHGHTSHKNSFGLQWNEIKRSDIEKDFHPSDVDAVIFWWKKLYCKQNQKVEEKDGIIFTCPVDESEYDKYEPQIVKNQNLAKFTESFDKATLKGHYLNTRRWRTGDKIDPLGMNGHHKSVSKILSNNGLTEMEKRTTWVVTDDTGIIWVIGQHISDSHKVTMNTEEDIRLSFI